MSSIKTMTDTEHVTFITGGQIEAIDCQTVQFVAWIDLPTTGERRVVARLVAPISVALELNMKMQEAIATVINQLQPEEQLH
jgi:hypothetical protein